MKYLALLLAILPFLSFDSVVAEEEQEKEKPPDIECIIGPDYAADILAQAIADQRSNPNSSLNDFLQRYNPFKVGTDTIYPVTRKFDVVGIRVYCRNKGGGTSGLGQLQASFELNNSKFKACPSSGVTDGLCVVVSQYQSGPPNYFSMPGTGSITGISSSFPENAQALLFIKNGGSQSRTIDPSDITFRLTPESGSTLSGPVQFSLKRPISIQYIGEASCSIAIAGADEPVSVLRCAPDVACNPTQVTRVKNRRLAFEAYIEDVPGQESKIMDIDWTGGPDKFGRFDNPTPQVEQVIRAVVLTNQDKKLQCAVRILPAGKPYQAEVSRFGDCEFFEKVRDFYFLDSESPKKLHTGQYNNGDGLKFATLNHAYGLSGPDIPFRGILNLADTLDGADLRLGLGGLVDEPPIATRVFHGLTITVTPFSMTANRPLGDPVLFAHVTGTGHLPNIDLVRTNRGKSIEELDENSYVVFHAFLPRSNLRQNPAGELMEARGSQEPGAIPLWRFIKEMDYIVPLAEASCTDIFKIGLPTRDKDKKPMPTALSNILLCAMSRPFQLKDVIRGRARIRLVNYTARNPLADYPVDLLRTSKNPPCIATVPEDTAFCYTVPQTEQPPAGDLPTAQSACWETKVIEKGETFTDMYGHSYTATHRTTVTTFKPSCQVQEGTGCGTSLAIRFSGYNMMSLAALGCVAKYDKDGSLSGVPVTATLKNQGIIPYTSFGGAAPRPYSLYPLTPLKGYGCIPCRFGTDDPNLMTTTKPIPVDTDAPLNPRIPVYAFTRSKAPRECVYPKSDITIRYFGAKDCDKISGPTWKGLCWSATVPLQNCPSISENMAASSDPLDKDKGVFSGSGNIAGRFQVPLCPGGKLEFNAVSASWSPLLVDVAGNGISVSRGFDDAVLFDIKGIGKRVLIDWPLNTKEVAFLVMPDQGKVTSIKELFGDYKAKNGFEALRRLDSNRDRFIDEKDKKFGELRLWFDRNRNAIAENEEITNLEQWGVTRISLEYKKPLRKGVVGKTLSSYYFNVKGNAFRNIEDHYFQEYWKDGRRVAAAPVPKQK